MNEAEAHLQNGALQLDSGNYAEALQSFDECWALASARPSREWDFSLVSRAMFGQAAALQMLRRFDESEATYERLLAFEPRAEEALANLISMSMEVYDLTRVDHYASRLLKLNPNHPIGLQGMAVIALDREDWEGAARYCSRIGEHAPECREAWHNLQYATGRVMSSLAPRPRHQKEM